ncbi:hypothetical protein BJX70DRAFT_403828 [Aspergillus crustosus]
MSSKLQIASTTTLSLSDQFQSTLASSQTSPQSATSDHGNELDPLSLLSASSTALKFHVTKLSLLTINSPFTPSAASATLSTLNESVLPSLTTATLLVTAEYHTKAFQTEIRVLTATALKELSLLVKVVQTVAQEKVDQKGLEQSEKDTVTVAAGRVWDACDVLIDVAARGVIGFVVRRAEQYRDLVRDAVEEIEAWDPDEDGDAIFYDLLSDDENKAGADVEEDGDEDDQSGSAALHTWKKDTLRILKPIAQIYPAIISNRIKKGPPTPLAQGNIKILESLLKDLQQIPDHVDEVAGALYEADLNKYTRQLGKTKSCAVNVLGLVVLPWGNGQPSTGDKFTTWSKTWIKVMEEVSKSIDEPLIPRSS